jgi:hypothetical protein
MEDYMRSQRGLLTDRDREIAKIPPWTHILRGTLQCHYAPCGKDSCRCRKSKQHHHGPYWYVAVSTAGKKKRVLIPAGQAPGARRAIAAYVKLWKGLCCISEINLSLLKAGHGGKR